MRWFFGFFFVSGFCSILYELVWLRSSMAQFGVTTALISIVLSMFMAGLGLGSWGSGRLIRRYGDRITFPALRLYSLVELLIGASAMLVPHQLLFGRNLLERIAPPSSSGYYFASAAWLALTLVPWCSLMGATIPLAMLAIGKSLRQEAPRSFSYLYLANVLGAVAGAIVPLFLIELFGFHGTLKIGAALNSLLAASAMALTLQNRTAEETVPSSILAAPLNRPRAERRLLVLLFTTGLTSMAMEVVWIRQFTPYLGTVVYAFATVLSLYLAGTFIGSRVYRRWSRKHEEEGRLVWVLLGFLALLPLFTANPGFRMPSLQRAALGIAPFAAVLGFLTPMLVDRWSGGDPDRAGTAYAVNVVGCILGPLLSGFLLLPLMNERWVLFVLASPWLAVGIRPGRSPVREKAERWRALQLAAPNAVALLALVLVFTSKGYEDQFPRREVLRDHTATIIATGEGMKKRLLVNGMGITNLTPITKMMAHLPLAFLDYQPRNALVVCFGMGTTYRSALSWQIPTVTVELVPSVPDLFGYYHVDGPELLRSPLSRLVIDDGRRYLERSSEQFDVIIVDPPPPVEAAGSSLLYSKEFYSIAKRRLRPGGILQQWLPGTDDAVIRASVARALKESFPFVHVFRSVEHWGFHFLASTRPIPNRTAAQLIKRIPAKAVRDLMEWGPEPNAELRFATVLKNELSLEEMVAEAPRAPALQDDRPMNEYYILRESVPERWAVAYLGGTR
jgi:spermidine synthase